jgi:UDP-N-acetylglucosamine--N-acetylmuramyl-(pentapeptide) pyrophosphoryl-undecaprenol N-acetylglucosamine transferase
MDGDSETLSALYDIPGNMPLVYVTGGAQGAHALNMAISDALPSLLEHVAVIHQCGPQLGNGDFARLREIRERLPLGMQSRYVPVERVGDELAHVYAASSVVVGRAGAGTVAELAALGIPSVLVPLPGAVEQLRNAQVLERAGGAQIIHQEHLTPASLTEAIGQLVGDPQRLEEMRCAALSVASGDPAARIADELELLAGATRPG